MSRRAFSSYFTQIALPLSVNTHVAMHSGSGGAPRTAGGRDMPGKWRNTRNNSEGEAALAAMASPSSSSRTGAEAVVFSIQFYGKTIGEVGLLDQDLSELDWTRFKSYIVSIALLGVVVFLCVCDVFVSVCFRMEG